VTDAVACARAGAIPRVVGASRFGAEVLHRPEKLRGQPWLACPCRTAAQRTDQVALCHPVVELAGDQRAFAKPLLGLAEVPGAQRGEALVQQHHAEVVPAGRAIPANRRVPGSATSLHKVIEPSRWVDHGCLRLGACLVGPGVSDAG
jgi:hypothetical protein